MMFASNLLAVLVGSLNLPVQYYMVPVRSYTVTHYLVCTQVFDLTSLENKSVCNFKRSCRNDGSYKN